MTYTEAVELQAKLEAALVTGTSVLTVSTAGDSVTYKSTQQIQNALAQVNRSIIAYQRRASRVNPYWSRPKWS